MSPDKLSGRRTANETEARDIVVLLRAAIVTVSDGCSRGEREDLSGPLAVDLLQRAGYAVLATRVVPDDRTTIAAALVSLCDGKCDLVLTTGGTGFSPRDVTPEATREVIEREAPGLAETVRWANVARVPRAVLSRGIAGIRGATLIVNLPGSPGAVRDGIEALLPLLPHALALMRDEPVDHTPPREPGAAVESHVPPARVVEIAANLDDLSPEIYESLYERLFAAGALDVFLTPILMKRNRPANLLTVIAAQDGIQAIADVIFAETSTFGLRYSILDRLVLDRRWETVGTPYGFVRIKVGRWQGLDASASPEYVDVKAAADASGVPLKTVFAAANAAYRDSLAT